MVEVLVDENESLGRIEHGDRDAQAMNQHFSFNFDIAGANDTAHAIRGFGDEIEARKLAIPLRVHEMHRKFYPAASNQSVVRNY